MSVGGHRARARQQGHLRLGAMEGWGCSDSGERRAVWSLVREPAAKPTTKGWYGTKKKYAEGGGRMAGRDEEEKRNRELVLLPHTCALTIKRACVHRGLDSLCSGSPNQSGHWIFLTNN